MNEETKDKVISWLKEKNINKVCECCGKNSWVLSDDIVVTTRLSGSTALLGGTTYPCILLICDICGNTKFFNAVVMGILTPSKKESKDE